MQIVYSVMILLIGFCLGSFYACIGYRIPNKISLIKPGSYCDNCKKSLKWYMNIPILSYIFLKGRCAYCKKKIDITSLIIETFTGLTFLASFLYFGFCYQFFICIILISALAVTCVSDFKYYYISDRVIFISIILELITYLVFLKFEEYNHFIIGMVFMFFLMLTVKLIGDKAFKRESLGGGDVKLMLLVGLSLGVINSLVSLFIASVLGIIAHFLFNKDNEEGIIPFGPFILMGTIIVFLLTNIL